MTATICRPVLQVTISKQAIQAVRVTKQLELTPHGHLIASQIKTVIG